MAAKQYDRIGKLHKLGYINKAWRERIFALDTSRHAMLYFRSDDALQAHLNSAGQAQTQAGTIALKGAVLYVADFLDYPFAVEVATRDAAATPTTTTRHFFLFASTASELRGWMEGLVAGGAIAAGPSAPMRAVPEGKRPASSMLGLGAAGDASSYSSMEEGDAGLEPLPFRVRLAKYGFLQKRGNWNSSYKTRFCRVEYDESAGAGADGGGIPYLVYYTSVETTPRQGAIPLHNVAVEDDTAANDGLGFKLTPPGSSRSYLMRAPSKAQKRKWCAILQRLADGERWAPVEEVAPSAAAVAPAPASAQASGLSAGSASQVVSPSARSGVGVAGAPGAAAALASYAAAPAPSAAQAGADGAAASSSGPRIVENGGQKFKRRVVKLKPRVAGGDSDEEGDNGAGGDSVDHSRDVSVSVAPGPIVAPIKTSTPTPAASSRAGGAGAAGVASPPSASGNPMSPAHFAESPAPVASPDASSRQEVREYSASSRRRQNERAAVAVNAAAPASSGVVVSAVVSPVAAANGVASAAAASSPSPSPDSDASGAPSPAALAESLAFVAAGTEVYKVPQGSFASVEKKRFYLLAVGSNAMANELLASARKEMKGKSSKKVAYYDSIRSGFLLHWDSSKAHAYESFVWLDPRAPRSVEEGQGWAVFWGQSAGLFAKKKLKSEFSTAVVQRRSFTVLTKERSIDLIVDNIDAFQHWKNVLVALDAQR